MDFRRGNVVNVLVHEGDTIAANDGVIELETDKAVVEIPCPQAGRVAKLHVAKGETIQVGQTILTVEAEETTQAAEPPLAASQAEPQATSAAKPQAEPAKPQAAIVAKPEAAAGILPPARRPTPGPRTGGRSGRSRPQRPAAAASRRKTCRRRQVRSRPQSLRSRNRQFPVSPARMPGEKFAARLSPRIRRTIADRNGPLRRDHPACDQFRQRRRDRPGRHPPERARRTLGPRRETEPLALCPEGRRRQPATTPGAQRHLRHGARSGRLQGIRESRSGGRYAARAGCARDPQCRPAERGRVGPGRCKRQSAGPGGPFGVEDLRGGTFTISNIGALGGAYSTPIINHPEVAILLLGRARWLPTVCGESHDRVEPRLMLPLSLSFDHRLVDGAAAARFLNDVIHMLENPGLLLLGP